MATLITLLNMDQLSLTELHALSTAMACHGARLVATAHRGTLILRIAPKLVEPFLESVARDVIPPHVTDAFALIA